MTATLVVSSGKLDEMTGAELVSLFNSLNPTKPVKRFSTHAAGVKRTLSLLAEQQGGDLPRAMAARAGRDVPTPKKTPRSSPQGRIRKPFDLPFSGKIKPHRENTKRALAIEILTKGCKFEVMRDAVGWNDRQAYEAIRILHTYLGYGVTESDSGIIRLVAA